MAFTFFGQPQISTGYHQRIATCKPARCAYCRGKGRHPSIPFTQCTVCNGQGSILAIEPHRKCPRCKGTGKKIFGIKCKACGGAGWAHANFGLW